MTDTLKFYSNFELYSYKDYLPVILWCSSIISGLAQAADMGVLYTE